MPRLPKFLTPTLIGWAAACALFGTLVSPRPASAQNPPPAPAEPPPVVTAPPATEAAPAATPVAPPEPGAAAEPKKDEKGVDWKKVPPVSKRAPVGWFLPPPSGPGYYSLWDQIRGNYRETPPKFPFGQFGLNSTPYFDYDFRYLEDPENTQHDWSDIYKRVHFGPNDNLLFSTGGEIRNRYMNELGGNRGLGQNNFYNLSRIRAYGDLWYMDRYRVFVEFMDTQSYGNRVSANPADNSGPDIQNAFVEARVGDPFGGPLMVRVGRQELIYGSQRLVSPPDWSNARRTFQGAKAYWANDQWSVDAFWTQPVVQVPNKLDSVDTNRNFFGLWGSYRPQAGTVFDLYYLGLTQANTTANGDTETFGSRFVGDLDKRFLYDFEGAFQFGQRAAKNVMAKMAVAGLGYRFAEVPWNPTFWAYYEYASGDPNPTGTTTYRTFNQLFPQGHNYFGYADIVGRQNIKDINFQFSVTPEQWMNLSVQYHIFHLDSAKDALYNSRGVAIRQDVKGLSGTFVGDELDFLANFHVTTHQDFMIGISKFFAGSFYKKTGNPNDVQLFYAQYSFKW